jgi:hypothetical protein
MAVGRTAERRFRRTRLRVRCKCRALRRPMLDRIRKKKAGVVEHLQAFDHAGLLVNEPPGAAGLPLV